MSVVKSDLTLFAIPKNFHGHFATIQRNAVTSWTRLDPRPEIFLFGREDGTAEIAADLGIRHFPEIARNEFNTPMIDDLFRRAEQQAISPLIGYINSDIVLTDEFSLALGRIRTRHEKFMIVGRRWDVDWDQSLDFSQPGWADSLRAAARRANAQRPGNYIDYFIFSRGLCNGLLPFALGRFVHDNYLLWLARSRGAALLDISPVVMAIHQNHDYSHSQAFADVRQSPEVKRNRLIAGPWWHLYTIEDATEILREDGVHPSHRHWWLMAKRLWSHPLTIFQLPRLVLQWLIRGGRSRRGSAAKDHNSVDITDNIVRKRSDKHKSQAINFRRVVMTLGIPIPMRLPFGSWWIARNDAVGRAIVQNRFENVECHFVEQFLKPGMIVLDIGAHHGFYTLLISRKVGESGSVIAFEPSPRERARLIRHLRLNTCKNVHVEGIALGQTEGHAELHVVQGRESGCNSFRPQQVSRHGRLETAETKAVSVGVARLDDYIRQHDLARVDFVKVDVEGAELAVLKGATEFLGRQPRPIILCEIQEIRTRPWGYPAREIVDFLRHREFRWYIPSAEGTMRPLPLDQIEFDGNFVAVPEERDALLRIG